MTTPTQKRSIRPLAPNVCEQCGGERTFVVTREKIECQRCGFVIRDSNGKPQPPMSAPKPTAPARDLTQYRVSYYISDIYQIEPFVESAYHTAMDYVGRQQWPEAIGALHRCIDYRPDFAEAHLWLSRLLDDPAKRRDHLHQVLAYFPTHPEALRELMILDGELSEDSRPFDEFTEAEQRTVNAAVAAEMASKHAVNCPRCGAPNLVAEGDGKLLSCAFCGYRDLEQAAAKKHNSLAAAMIKRRSQPVQWIVGERWIKCNSCGAARTLTKRQLSDYCPFCSSKQIVMQDALKTIQQPDGIIRFAVPQRQALEQIAAELKRWHQRLANVFNTNRVERVEIEGVYLPFWVFDALVMVQRSLISNGQRWQRFEQPDLQNAYRVEQLPTMKNNILVCGVNSPPRALTQGLGKYRLSNVQEYAPKYLAQFSAEIYTLDFDRAAMDAHEQISQQIHADYSHKESSDMAVVVAPMIQQMSFRLLLLPVWSATVFEKDGDVRPALVNGQTGRVALGKARKPTL
jgi:DNA-directed RNA polymerase subunit RPC12/RpoP/ribosomal protein S27AE